MNFEYMNFDALNRYIVLVKHLNFTRAAEELYLTQPAVSMQLKKLEDELGCPLMQRSSDGLSLTDAGKTFYQRALNIMAEYSSLMRELSPANRGRLRVGYCTTGHSNILASALANHFSSGDLDIRLHHDTPSGIRQLFLSGELDCILFHRASATPLIDIASIRKIRSCSLMAVMRRDHPMANAVSVTFKDLASSPWILFQRENCEYHYDYFMSLFQQHNSMPDRIYDDMNYNYAHTLTRIRNGFYLTAEIETPPEGLISHIILPPKSESDLVFVTKKDTSDPLTEELYYALMNCT